MRIRGSVKNAATGAPLRGVRISGTITGVAILDAITDERGEFAYQDERTQYEGRRIRVCAEHAGYKSAVEEQAVPPGELRLEFALSKEIAAPIATGVTRARRSLVEVIGRYRVVVIVAVIVVGLAVIAAVIYGLHFRYPHRDRFGSHSAAPLKTAPIGEQAWLSSRAAVG